MKNNIIKEKGAVTVVEATFVFPIMFFIIFILLFYGNACYIASNVESAVSTVAIEAAAEAADPLLETVKNNGEVPRTKVTTKPYRYLSSGYGDGVASGYKTTLKDKIKKFGGISADMVPKDIKCNVQYKNYFIYQKIIVSADYKIKIPVRMIFSKDYYFVKYSSSDEISLNDTSELILNTNMVMDYAQRTGLTEKLKGLTEKLKKFF